MQAISPFFSGFLLRFFCPSGPQFEQGFGRELGRSLDELPKLQGTACVFVRFSHY